MCLRLGGLAGVPIPGEDLYIGHQRSRAVFWSLGILEGVHKAFTGSCRCAR